MPRAKKIPKDTLLLENKVAPRRDKGYRIRVCAQDAEGHRWFKEYESPHLAMREALDKVGVEGCIYMVMSIEVYSPAWLTKTVLEFYEGMTAPRQNDEALELAMSFAS